MSGPLSMEFSRLLSLFDVPVVWTSLILFVAYLVRGIAGFGSGLIAIPAGSEES